MMTPSDTDAERALIGCILLDGCATADSLAVVALLPPDAFSYVPHRNVYEVLSRLLRAGEPVDEISVTHHCPAHGILVSDIAANAVTSANMPHYARIVLDTWLGRQLVVAANDVIAKARVPGAHMADVLAAHGMAVATIAEATSAYRLHDLVDSMSQRCQEFARIVDGTAVERGVKTGLTDLDAALGGFKPGQLIVLAARPGAGKTSLELAFLLSSGLLHGGALAFSLEMSASEMADRALAWIARLDLQRLTNLRVTADECARAVDATERARGQLQVLVDDSPGITLDRIRAKARQVKARRGLSLVAVDYLQLMNGHGESREREVANISRGLKQLAKELEVPIVALSQLNRGPEARENKEPFMSDLRESGALEQDADVILLLWRRPDDTGRVTCKIAKHRNGPLRDIELGWSPASARFQNLSTRSTP